MRTRASEGGEKIKLNKSRLIETKCNTRRDMQVTFEHIAYNEFTKEYKILGDVETYSEILHEIGKEYDQFDFDFLTVTGVAFHKGKPVKVEVFNIKSKLVNVPVIDFGTSTYNWIG